MPTEHNHFKIDINFKSTESLLKSYFSKKNGNSYNLKKIGFMIKSRLNYEQKLCFVDIKTFLALKISLFKLGVPYGCTKK